MEIKNIIFDFGGVLVDWNPRYMYKKVFDDKSEMEYFLTNICTEEWNLQQDKDRSLAEGTQFLIQKFPNHAYFIKLFYERWEEMLKGLIEENVKLISILKPEYKLYGLTNWSAETFPIALKKYAFFQEFDGIVVSGTEKLIKPDPKIFNLLLSRYLLKAQESVFIDDNILNIITAKEIGFHTIHINETTNLEFELKQMNII
ncbi:MAG: HAD family phosphatase [Flavobacteriaceae bacterium]|nr:HAD family phosphatase [Flavobacteriaceae bacterium]